MRKIFTLLSVLALAACPLLAQDIDETFMFVDENEELVENGATIVRNLVETNDDGLEVIYSGLSVADMGAAPNVYLKMKYFISQIDNGSFQICFPMTCNMQTAAGMYETSPGQVNMGLQDIQSEWFPTADGTCVVTLSIETLTKSAGFPPRYDHLGDGPTVTLKFVKGGAPEPLKGDVNNDGEVNISDVNAMIDFILSSSEDPIADVNGDGEINISDVNEVISIILGGN